MTADKREPRRSSHRSPSAVHVRLAPSQQAVTLWISRLFSRAFPPHFQAACGASAWFSTVCGKWCGKEVVSHIINLLVLWIIPNFPLDNDNRTKRGRGNRRKSCPQDCGKASTTKTVHRAFVDRTGEFSTIDRLYVFRNDVSRVPMTENRASFDERRPFSAEYPHERFGF